MKRRSLFIVYFINVIIRYYALDCCDKCCENLVTKSIYAKFKNIFNHNIHNKPTFEEVHTSLKTNNFQKITKQFNYHNEEGICVFISTIQNIFRRNCYLNKLNECLEIVRDNIEKIDEDLIYGIYDLLMINKELFNANLKEETKNVFEKYLTVSEMDKTNAEEKVNDISNLKFCDDNHCFIHYSYPRVLVKVLFGLLNKILEIGNKKKIFILDTPYVFSYFAMNEKMNKNEYKIKQKEKKEERINENFNEKKKNKTFEKILNGEEDAFESDFFIILLDDELLQECDIYNFSYNNCVYEIFGMIKIHEDLQVGTDGHAIAIVKEENKMNFYNDNEGEIFEYNPLKPWDYRFFNKCLFFEKANKTNTDINYNSYQYFINKQKEEPFPIIYRKGKIYATLFEWHYLEGKENEDNPQILAYSWNKDTIYEHKEEFYEDFFNKINTDTWNCKLINYSLVCSCSSIKGDTTIEKLKKCYEMKIKEDEDYEKFIDKKKNCSYKSCLDNFFENNLSHCDLYDASVLYKNFGKEEFFSKTKKLPHFAKTFLNGRIFVIYEDNKICYL